MNLRSIKDGELHNQTKHLVSKERHLLTQVLHHLREIERRKLFSDFSCQSLFEYAVKELKYSEGQAGRRIQAMRLMKELPQVEEKIERGELSLSNISQAQSYFREAKKSGARSVAPAEKLELLERLENKSAREGQRLILSLSPDHKILTERSRAVSSTQTEVRFVITDQLKDQLEEFRSLLGPKGATMGMAELVEAMTEISLESLKKKKFGQRRELKQMALCDATPASESGSSSSPNSDFRKLNPVSKNPRYIPRAIKYELWIRDRGECVMCGSRRNLNVDHVQPVALGGDSTISNLRLLCFNCNQRYSFKSFNRSTDSFKKAGEI